MTKFIHWYYLSESQLEVGFEKWPSNLLVIGIWVYSIWRLQSTVKLEHWKLESLVKLQHTWNPVHKRYIIFYSHNCEHFCRLLGCLKFWNFTVIHSFKKKDKSKMIHVCLAIQLYLQLVLIHTNIYFYSSFWLALFCLLWTYPLGTIYTCRIMFAYIL